MVMPRHYKKEKSPAGPKRQCINGPKNGGTCKEFIYSKYAGRCPRCIASPPDARYLNRD